MPRILITADLHYNHGKSKELAEDVIDRMNAAGGDILLVVGDTAGGDGDALERCLSRFTFSGPKLLVAGNHELWTRGEDSYALFAESLPRRAAALGWHWLEGEPFVAGDVAVVGSVGWYDYSFAPEYLSIPRRFYEAKLTPGAAMRLSEFVHLHPEADDVPDAAREVYARWNDGKFALLGRSDEAFLQECLDGLRHSLDQTRSVPTVVAGIHHLPFRALLPPMRMPQWDFAHAFLGTERLGQLLLEYPNVKNVYCGHSHFAAEATVSRLKAVNVGSSYRWKTFLTLDVK